MRTQTIKTDKLPLSIHLDEIEPIEFISYYAANKEQIEKDLCLYGAIKFEGIRIETAETFQLIIDAIASKFAGYVDGTSPRTQLTNQVYTSTEYDKKLRITMHNELSYSSHWPGRLFFCCLQPAESGGETLLADSRKILAEMDTTIVSEVEKRGITYIRNLHSGDSAGMSWKQAFQTDNKKELERICAAYGIEYEWSEQDKVRLKQTKPGIITHPVTAEKVWFNQLDQFHPYQLGEEVYEALLMIHETPDDLPTYVRFGDGGTISDDLVKTVLSTIDALTVFPPWEKNQILLVDNVLVSHGRSPYEGNRKVVVAMAD